MSAPNKIRLTIQASGSGILLHGDAAFAGQGVVAETFDFSALRVTEQGELFILS